MTHRHLLPALALLAAAPAARAVDPADLKPGLVATFTDGTNTVSRVEPTVALSLAPGQAAHPRLKPITTATWAGYLNVLRPGSYEFSATAGGSGWLAVKVDGKEVLKAPTVEVVGRVTSGPVTLKAGVQPFAVNFETSGGPVRLELFWEGPGIRREPLHHLHLGHLPAERPKTFAADAAAEAGRFRFEELGCVRCHKPGDTDAVAKTLADRPGPVLTDVAKRAYAGWLDAWLADPHKLRPNAAMPKMFADTDAGKAERYAVVAYLVGLAGGPLDQPKLPTVSNQYSQSMRKGQDLFAVTGCAACHQQVEAKKKRNDEEDDKAPLEPEDYVYGGPPLKYALGAVGSKTRPEALATFLQDPLKTHPAGRMPNMALTGTDATDIARYLCRTTDDTITAKMPAEPKTKPAALAETLLDATDLPKFAKLPTAKQWAELGKALVVSKGCVNCHEVKDGGKTLAPAAKFPPLAAVSKAAARTGCLSDDPHAGKAPDYKLSKADTLAVTAFLKDGLTGAGSPSPVHAARVAMKRFNCTNCHIKDGEGGIPLALADQMKALEKAENADDVKPPLLTGIGHKSRTSWLKGVLTQGQRARPWMQLRMPQYGEKNVGFLPDALAALEGTAPDDTVHKVPLSAVKIEAGRVVVGKGGMGCISCHDISGIPNTGTRGPDLATINQRVRHEWYVRWLHQPLRMAPGTRMPQAFVDGKSPLAAVLAGDADAQAEAMWAYLSLGPGLPLPDGMEPPKGLTIAVKDRAEVLRTFMPEAGAKAIAVGYPGGVNLSFAADQCRLSYAWAGNFVDASPVWNNRGGAPAKLLGPKFWTAPPGHPWALTANPEVTPDFLSRANSPVYGAPFPLEPARVNTGPVVVGFDGYTLGRGGNPTFRYHLAGNADAVLRITEAPEPIRGGIATGVRRHFGAEIPAGYRAWLLAGATTKPPRFLGPNGETVRPTAGEADAAAVRVVLPADGDRAVVLAATDAPAGTVWRVAPQPAGGFLVVLKLPADEKPQAVSFAVNVWAVPKDDDALLKGLAAGR